MLDKVNFAPGIIMLSSEKLMISLVIAAIVAYDVAFESMPNTGYKMRFYCQGRHDMYFSAEVSQEDYRKIVAAITKGKDPGPLSNIMNPY